MDTAIAIVIFGLIGLIILLLIVGGICSIMAGYSYDSPPNPKQNVKRYNSIQASRESRNQCNQEYPLSNDIPFNPNRRR